MPRGRRAPTIGRLVPPAPSQADFHAHTARSDGLLAPAELLAAAAAAGVRTLAVTDHDTLAGYREVVLPCAPPLPAGLAVIAGVEINATARDIPDLPDGELHVVGLGSTRGRRLRGAPRRPAWGPPPSLRADGGPPREIGVPWTPAGEPRSRRRGGAGAPHDRPGSRGCRFAADVQDAFARLVGRQARLRAAGGDEPAGGPGAIRARAACPSGPLRPRPAAGGPGPGPHRGGAGRDRETHHRSFERRP